MSTILFHAQFKASKIGKTALTPTIDIKSVRRSDGTIAAVVTGGSMSENWRGFYFYRLAGADLAIYDYEAVAITSDTTVDDKELACLWTRFSEAIASDANGKVPATLAAGDLAAGSITAAVVATDAIDADALAADAVTEIQSGLSTLNAVGVRTAVGLATNNLDTQLSAITGYIDTEVATAITDLVALLALTDPTTALAAVKVVTDHLGTALELDGSEYRFTANALEQAPASLEAADVWSAPERTLTQSAASIVAVLSGSAIVIRRGDSWSHSLTALGSLTGRLKLWFTAKRHDTDLDSAALIQLTEGHGITVDNAGSGNITLRLSAAATALLPKVTDGVYDVQVQNADGSITTLTEAALSVEADVTRSIG